jgi:2-keto-4-pentenoate hydratase
VRSAADTLMHRLGRVFDAVATNCKNCRGSTIAAAARTHTTAAQAGASTTVVSSRLAADAAAILARARARIGAERQKIGHLPGALHDLVCDERGAYAVQQELHELLAEQRPELGGICGTKIGCTTAVMQEYLGMPHPCAGAIWSSTAFVGQGEFTGLWRAGVECEIAVRLARDIEPLAPGAQHTRESVSAAVGEVMAAIEIVDDRYVKFEERVPGPYVLRIP